MFVLMIFNNKLSFFNSRHKILNTMIEQRHQLESLYMNDTVEEQNRILRQINDFIMVLSKDLCENIGTQVDFLLDKE